MKPPYRWHKGRGILDADGSQALQLLGGTESRNKFGPHLAQLMNDLAKAQGTAKDAVSPIGTGSDVPEQVNRLLGHPCGLERRIDASCAFAALAVYLSLWTA